MQSDRYGLSEKDFLPDESLGMIEQNLIPKVPVDFSLSTQAYAGTVVLTLRFDRKDAVQTRVEQAEALCSAAMCIDTLVKNLRAARQKVAELERSR